MNVFASDNFRYFSRATHVYFCEVARNCHALRTSLSFAEWSCKMSLLVIQNPPYVGGEISNSRLHNDLRDVRFLAIARWEPGVPGIGKFSESSCVRVFRCDTTDVCQTELAIIFAITVNCFTNYVFFNVKFLVLFGVFDIVLFRCTIVVDMMSCLVTKPVHFLV